MDEIESKKSKSKVKKVTLWIVGLTLLWVLLTGAFILLLKPDQSEKFRQQLHALSTSFPLYCPDKPPKGIELSANSVAETSQFVTFSMSKGNNQITVTQQARPELMEEVNKIQDVSSPLGKAYIAGLEKRSVGFLETDKTLLTITSTENLDNETLTGLLQSIVAL